MGKLIKIFLLFALCVLVIPLEADAARVAFTGFEWGSSAEFFNLGGTFSFVASPVNPGGSQTSLRINPTTTNSGSIRMQTFGATGASVAFGGTGTLYHSFSFRYATN